jgi:hypothetical protein
LIRPLLFALALGLPVTAQAQSIGPCDGWQSSAALVAEPWEANTALFANGAVRLAIIDTFEPAAASFHLMILSPPYDELGYRQCVLVSGPEGEGLAGLTLEGIVADYDPAAGLRFKLRASRWLMETDTYKDAVLSVTLNQATGAVTARLD